MNRDSKGDESIDRFVIEVIMSFMPEVFDKEKNQSHGIQALQVNSKNLKSSFNFGTITENHKWISIFKSINLQTDEVMQITLANHALSVRSLGGGKYKIYDPNYSFGFKEVQNEKELVNELEQISSRLRMKNQKLGMSLQVIRHPDVPRKLEFPDPAILYNDYRTPGASLKIPGSEAVIEHVYFSISLDD